MSIGEISNLDVYLNRMQKSMLDKMFFIDKVFEPFNYIVDFGCANGELIKQMSLLFPEYKYIGYDISTQMINEAKQNTTNIDFYTNWNDINVPFDKSLLNISSTIHEVYSYSLDSIEEFWNRVFNSGFKYIAIRDMMFADSQNKQVDIKQLNNVLNNSKYTELLADFESKKGKITTQKQLIHFLLKYKYIQNWDREVLEDYFPISYEKLISIIPSGYNIIYNETYILPYIKWQIKKDFNIDIKENTHVKLILEKI